MIRTAINSKYDKRVPGCLLCKYRHSNGPDDWSIPQVGNWEIVKSSYHTFIPGWSWKDDFWIKVVSENIYLRSLLSPWQRRMSLMGTWEIMQMAEDHVWHAWNSEFVSQSSSPALTHIYLLTYTCIQTYTLTHIHKSTHTSASHLVWPW